ncbi:hypothetical protein SUGI_0714140 [Cryptomeria japonica]|nr:hypothetical protein SUGI_0714140 [Cryptomeria japonica]
MPPSALSCLISQEIEYRMLFQLQNTITGHISHGGVLEFVAKEDLEVDFAPPLDYKEPERLPLNPTNICTTTSSARTTREITSREHGEESQCRFSACTRVGRRLDGKPLSPKSPKIKSARSRSPSRAPIRQPGKLVFGGNTIHTHVLAMEFVKVGT